ncbi:UvrD-helicase domain-containing protein [Streptosporangium sp. NPDC087985]|uniref:UvrD-helicase domain-containing protein n=1 Tax=Streptosporangium sp. NPDC087985 TaxID=3366196 RepID=UPI0038035B54
MAAYDLPGRWPVMFTQPGAVAHPGFTAPVAASVFEHPPTGEQAAILDAAATGNDLVIEAGAGTGKTSTLKMVAALTMKRGLYLAYNRSIADDARASFPANVQCSTAHSLAFAVVGRQFVHRLNGPRLPAREVARILGIPAVLDLGAHALTAPKVARLVMDAIKRFCYSDDDEPQPQHIASIPGMEPGPDDADGPGPMWTLREQAMPMLLRAWEDLQRADGRLKFEHDHYLKLWALTRPTLPAEFVCLDEAQDANPVIAQIVEAQASQRILVGDQSQAIYGWRGAVDAMETFEGARFQLSQSFRFGQRIADEANTWLEMLGAPLRLTGNPALDSRIERIAAPAAVLCRTNAGAIGQIIAAIGSGHRAALVGGGDDIRRLAEACRDLRSGKGTYHPELMAFSSWAEVQDYAEHDAGGQDLKTLVQLVDSHGPEAIIRVVDQLVDEHNATVVVSTAHKAKGREWPTVRLAADFPPPHDKEGNLIPAEAMLAYVAVTRAKQGLDPSALPGSTPLPEPTWNLASIVDTLKDAVARDAADTSDDYQPWLGAPDQQLPMADVLVQDPEPIGTDLPADEAQAWPGVASCVFDCHSCGTSASQCLDGDRVNGAGGCCPACFSSNTHAKPPPPAMDTLTPDPEPIGTDLPADLVGWLTLAKEARENKTRWADIEAAAVEKLKDWIAARGLEEATVAGRPAITWKTSKPGMQLDGKALEKDHPDIYAAYVKPKKASRPFNLTGEWK